MSNTAGTPRTDALIVAAIADPHRPHEYDLTVLARTLERENAKLRAALEDAMRRAATYGMVDLPQDISAALAKGAI